MARKSNRRKRGKPSPPISLPGAYYGERGYSSWPERERIRQMLERDKADEDHAKALKQRNSPAYDRPAVGSQAVAINPSDPETRRRYRALPADHPLVKAWVNEKIDAEMFNAGNVYRLLFEKANDPAGRDSTQAMFVNGGGPDSRTNLKSAEIQRAEKSLTRVERQIGSEVDRKIVRAFCGRRVSANAAVEGATRYHCPSNAVWPRMREALTSLTKAVTKSGVESGPDHGAVAQYLEKTA
jgi:hypothetical protein